MIGNMTSLLDVKNAAGSSVLPMAHWERKLVTFDFTPDLATGETITGATAHLVNVESGAEYPPALDGPAVPDGTGKLVMQWIDSPEPNETYRLVLVATTTTGERSAPDLTIVVEY